MVSPLFRGHNTKQVKQPYINSLICNCTYSHCFWPVSKKVHTYILHNYPIFLSFSDGTCRTVSHGKLEHLYSEGYRHILNVDWYKFNSLKYSELGPGIPGKPCVFPFKVNGIEFNECTSYQSPYGWPRCATKESQDLDRPRVGYSTNMVSSWGFCSQECPVEGTTMWFF